MTDMMEKVVAEVELARESLRYAQALGDEPTIIYKRVQLRQAEAEVWSLWRIEALLERKEKGK